MCKPTVKIVLVAVVMIVKNYECKDFVLSASDQSLIEMMKHYLHTSRRLECPNQGKTSNSGVTYVRWGKKTCPHGSEIVYTGQVGGNDHQSKGGGVNYLCLPNDPENGQHQSYSNDQVYGAEYEPGYSIKPSGWSESMHNQEVPCAVCYQKLRSTVMMIPGRKTCYKGWNAEYNGFLMSDHVTYNKKDFACVDNNAEPLDNKNGNQNGALFYPLRTKCGSLRCPPYTNESDVLCVVCTK
ncbi:short-chain collagen C4-like [Mytilus galloprovincialis]|uniref:short-chain collagen C4-like n=1 Tax=Mytilus galloprovincialis TaxID=29158 RepID=UPI003F7B42BF